MNLLSDNSASWGEDSWRPWLPERRSRLSMIVLLLWVIPDIPLSSLSAEDWAIEAWVLLVDGRLPLSTQPMNHMWTSLISDNQPNLNLSIWPLELGIVLADSWLVAEAPYHRWNLWCDWRTSASEWGSWCSDLPWGLMSARESSLTGHLRSPLSRSIHKSFPTAVLNSWWVTLSLWLLWSSGTAWSLRPVVATLPVTSKMLSSSSVNFWENAIDVANLGRLDVLPKNSTIMWRCSSSW